MNLSLPPFQTSLQDRYKCQDDVYQSRNKSSDADPDCLYDPEAFEFRQRTPPRTNESLFTLSCLHHFCRIPQIPEGLDYKFRQLQQDVAVLEYTYNNASILFLVGFGVVRYCITTSRLGTLTLTQLLYIPADF